MVFFTIVVLKSPPIAAQLLHHFTPSEQITPTLLHQFTPPPTLTSKWEDFREDIRPGNILPNTRNNSMKELTGSWSVSYGGGGGYMQKKWDGQKRLEIHTYLSQCTELKTFFKN